MKRKLIIVQKSSDDPAVGWRASVAKQYAPKGAKSSVALGESEYYATKEQAWESVQKRVEKLDFVSDDVSFNLEKVNSYVEVLQKVEEL